MRGGTVKNHLQKFQNALDIEDLKQTQVIQYQISSSLLCHIVEQNKFISFTG